MAIRVRDKGKDFVPAPDGLQRAVCCDVVEQGLVDGPFGRRRKVELRFQSENRMDDGKPFLLRKSYGATLHKKATLRADLESWRGKPLTDAEADDFDLEAVLGKNCQLLVVHNAKDGITYANIKSIVPPPKGTPPLKVENYKRVQDREDYKAPEMPVEREPGDETEVVIEGEAEDDIPF